MRALTWHGRHDVRVETVPDPEIVNPRDAILRVTSTAICGSDLHLYDGYIPTLRAGDVLGHEFMGEVIETGPKSSLQRASASSCRLRSAAATASSARRSNIAPATIAIRPRHPTFRE
jgi:NADPH:quinone reductase-like Zn-dependent oxidoreductase